MPFRPINPAAAGFLGLLQLKSNGRNPEALLEEVRPIIDMEYFYLLGQAQIAYRGIIPSANYSGFIAPDFDQTSAVVGPLVVPPGVLWYVHELSADVITGNADIVSISGARAAVVVPIDTNVGHLVYADDSTNVQIGTLFATSLVNNYTVKFTPLKGVWLPAGSILGISWAELYAEQSGVVAINEVHVTVRYTEVPI